MKTWILLSLFLLATPSLAKNYDYIVAGTGAAGAVLCKELSDVPKNKVLCLDWGVDETDFLRVNPGFYDGLPPLDKFPWLDHHYSQEQNPNPGMGVRSIYYPNTKILGGGTSVNGNIFQRPPEDELAGYNSPLWTFDAVLDDWKALTTVVGGDPTIQGTSGPITVITPPPNAKQAAIQATAAAIFGISANPDLGDRTGRGIGSIPRNILEINGTGLRSDPYFEILKPVLGRKNLKVVTAAFVNRILLSPSGKHRIEYFVDGDLVRSKAKKELILSLGWQSNVKLLLQSGIGPCDELEALGIECIVENDFVGKNFIFKSLTSQLYLGFAPPPSYSDGHITGILYDYVDAFNRTNTNEVLAFCLPRPGSEVCLVALSQHGLSPTGQVTLRTKNDFEEPNLKFDMYADPTEIEALVDAFKKARITMSANGYVEIRPGFTAVPFDATDAQIAAYLFGVVIAEHAVGSCKMHEVVDERLRVIDNHGNVVHGLRVIDASIIPVATTVHSAAATSVLIGKVGARLVLEDN